MHCVVRLQRCHRRVSSVLVIPACLYRRFATVEISHAQASRDVAEYRRRSSTSPIRRKTLKFNPDKSKWPAELPQDITQQDTSVLTASSNDDTKASAVSAAGERVEDDADVDDDDDDDVVEADKEPDMTAFDGIRYPRSRSGKFHSNVFFIRETRGGPQMIPYPIYDDDELQDETHKQQTSQSGLVPPPPLTSRRSAKSIIGQAIGGEKLSYADLSRLNERDIDEHYSKGGGRGGQKVNKTNNCVHLLHIPTGTSVKCHATRSLEDNRRIAREILKRRLDELCNGPNSVNGKREQKIRKSKSKSRRRAQAKYGGQQESTVSGDHDDHDDIDGTSRLDHR